VVFKFSVVRALLHYFVGKDGIEHLLENFEIVKLESSEKEVEGKLRSRWIIIATVK
jgi:hypothetical protein